MTAHPPAVCRTIVALALTTVAAACSDPAPVAPSTVLSTPANSPVTPAPPPGTGGGAPTSGAPYRLTDLVTDEAGAPLADATVCLDYLSRLGAPGGVGMLQVFGRGTEVATHIAIAQSPDSPDIVKHEPRPTTVR